MTSKIDGESIFTLMFSWFKTIWTSFVDIVNYMTTPINTIDDGLPDVIETLLNKSEWYSNFSSNTLFSIMLGTGVTLFIIISVIKYVLDIIK